MFLFDMEPTWVDHASEEATSVTTANAGYDVNLTRCTSLNCVQELIRRKLNAPDSFVDRIAQTDVQDSKTRVMEALCRLLDHF